jgi:chromosome segregation ATPase
VTAADCARFEAVLESIQASVHAVAEGQVALLDRCDRIETRLDRLEGRIEQVAIQLTAIDVKLTAIDVKLTAIDTKLDTFSVDTQSRLERIETHIRLGRPPRPGKRPPRGSTTRRKAA